MTEYELKARDKARKDDFEFMVLCASKQNMGMYHLLRDRSLDEKDPQQPLFEEKQP